MSSRSELVRVAEDFEFEHEDGIERWSSVVGAIGLCAERSQRLEVDDGIAFA